MKRLTQADVERYDRDGLLFPIPVLSAAELARFRAAYDALAAEKGKPTPMQLGQCHLFFRWAYELATTPAVLDAVEDVIGPDILIHSSTIFPKYPRDPSFVAWHQDGYYWRLDEPRLTSAWIALTDSTRANGCVRIVPGSHRERLEHRMQPKADAILASGLEVNADVDEAQAADVELRAGEMSLHHVNAIHGSQPNSTDGMRIGMAVRYVSPYVRQGGTHHPVLLARGSDRAGYYEHGTPPLRERADAVAAHASFVAAVHERFAAESRKSA
jgi:non-haem Fe2+, alpha-ketoglutarate-dependent halogenase